LCTSSIFNTNKANEILATNSVHDLLNDITIDLLETVKGIVTFRHCIRNVRGYTRWEFFVAITTDFVTVEALSESIELALDEVRPEPLYKLTIIADETISWMADCATYY
jgi:hypothetical protein